MAPSPPDRAARSVDWPIDRLPGLGQADLDRLIQAGISTTGQLACYKTAGQAQQTLARQLHVSETLLQKWVVLSELARIPSVNYRYCGLLLHAGITSPSQLAQTAPERLHQQILRLQVSLMQRRDLCPSVDEVRQWVVQARRQAIAPAESMRLPPTSADSSSPISVET